MCLKRNTASKLPIYSILVKKNALLESIRTRIRIGQKRLRTHEASQSISAPRVPLSVICVVSLRLQFIFRAFCSNSKIIHSLPGVRGKCQVREYCRKGRDGELCLVEVANVSEWLAVPPCFYLFPHTILKPHSLPTLKYCVYKYLCSVYLVTMVS